LPKLIQDAIISYQGYRQQPISIIACSALANVFLACQTLANVACDHMLVSTVSLYFLVAASSDERKSAADKVFGEGIRQWQTKTRAKIADKATEQQLLHRIWLHQKEGLLKQVRKLTLNGDSSFIEEQQLHQLAANEPEMLLSSKTNLNRYLNIDNIQLENVFT
jgi:hypothetical protein